MNSVSLNMCYSNASYVKNTLENDAILRVGGPNQALHITTAIPGQCNALLTMKDNIISINGNLIVHGLLQSSNISANNIVGNSSNQDQTTNNNNVNFGDFFIKETSLLQTTTYASNINIDNNISTPILDETISIPKIFVGEYDKNSTLLDSNVLYTNEAFVGDSSNYTYTGTSNYIGVLGVLNGGTGVTEKTGEGKVVLNSNPHFEGSIYAASNDSSSNPGYSWTGFENTGFFYNNLGNNIGISVNNNNVMSIYSNGIDVIGDCSASMFTTTSDKRIKYNMHIIDDAINTITKLTPQMYTKKYGDISTLESGLIAQDLYSNVPELRHLLKISSDADVLQDNWGSTLARINYIGIIPYLVKSIQELKIELDKKEIRIQELEKMIF